jgi:S-adenosylmethionine:tRNA ribosyltransferase-isomerase
MMASAFFDYELPSHLIAQEPCAERDQARLLVVRRQNRSLEHRIFKDLPELLDHGDLLVMNDTRVVPARLLGKRARTGGGWQGLFLRQLPDGLWELMCQTRGRLLEGETIQIEPGPLELTLSARTAAGTWLCSPRAEAAAGQSALELLERHGRVPLPPYIRKGRARAADRERYQTIYAKEQGAVAAPTAGLHFTPRLLEALDQRGINRAFVTLHVGLGTFQSIQVKDFAQHRMHQEWGALPAETAKAMAAGKAQGKRVVAVGTTTVRILETVAATGGIRTWSGETDLFIYPPYPFKAVDALITNFHLPRSTLLMLVGAFAGVDLIRHAYMTAVARNYRFFSYGDAMLIL